MVADWWDLRPASTSTAHLSRSRTRPQYTIASLITALEAAINAAINPETMTITQDALTQKLTFAQSSGTFSCTIMRMGRIWPRCWGSL